MYWLSRTHWLCSVIGPIGRIVCSGLAVLWLEQVGSCSGVVSEEMLHDCGPYWPLSFPFYLSQINSALASQSNAKESKKHVVVCASKFTPELAVNGVAWLSLSSSLPCHHWDAWGPFHSLWCASFSRPPCLSLLENVEDGELFRNP